MSAYISEDGLYRYSLTRDVAPLTGEGTCTFVMLNPSTADAMQDDPTIRRCMGFAASWGFARLKVVNLYGYRATSPGELLDTDDPVGPDNDCTVAKVIGGSDLIVVAWGASAHPLPDRVERILGLIAAPHCVGLTSQGFPRHPLYVKGDAMPQPFGDVHPKAAWKAAA